LNIKVFITFFKKLIWEVEEMTDNNELPMRSDEQGAHIVDHKESVA